MPRPAKKLHELVPVRNAVVNCRGTQFHLGPWDAAKDALSADAVAKFARYAE